MKLINVLSLSDPFDCGATTGCGGDGWLISDPTLSTFVVNATCSDSAATPFSSLFAINCKCPVAPILPCTCLPTNGDNTTLTIDCSSQGLDDSAMEAIVKNIPATTPMTVFNLDNNLLTRIPANLPQYTQLHTLIISMNKISAVNANEVTLLADVKNLDLSSNKITQIAAASLPGI